MPTYRHLVPRALGDRTLPWTRDDALVAVGAAAVDLLGYLIGSQTDGITVTVPGVALVVGTAMPLLFRRRDPLLAFAAVLVLSGTLNLTVQTPQNFGGAVVVGLYSVARARGLLVTVPAAVAAAGVPLLGHAAGPYPLRWNIVGNVAAAALVVGAAVVINRWQQDVEAKRRLLAERAVAEERRRIARELHDIVSHHITTMQLMAGGARANLAHDTDVVRDALVTLENSGRMALREMRQLLDVLRADDEPDEAPPAPQPGAADLDRIVAESCRAGLPTEFTVHGRERPLPPTIGLTVFRIVQEALTNARKHAGQARAQVHLTYGPDRLVVAVRDDGSGSSAGAGGGGPNRSGRSGYGLIGMHERVTLHGGSLSTGPLDGGGFEVRAGLPLAPYEQSPQAEEGAAEGEDLPR
ncbi:histidine kinase [Streptomyces sp. NPDC005485]|uniref:sensor histidine kinase n=1 Tax=Streptomyces sp. NPDC005485 TaxID=3155591 RepID=UPI0033A13403